jgi:nitrous oxidase accessory protein NosD
MAGELIRVARTAIVVCALVLPAAQTIAAGKTHIVCAASARRGACQFVGPDSIQKAIDHAASGDAIVIKAGRYAPAAFRDVTYKDFKVRGFIVIDGKDLSIEGERGAVLDGASGPATTAIVVRRAQVVLRNLDIANFRYEVEEDDIYDGHGVFVIDGTVRIDNLSIRRFRKMGLTGRGASLLDVSNLRLTEGHIGLWLHESAYLRLRNSLVKGNDGSGIAAYDNCVAHVFNSVFDANLDDGIYTEHQAMIFATNSLILRNKPVGLHALGDSRIWLGYSALFANATSFGSKDHAKVLLGSGVIESDPRTDSEYRLLSDSPLKGKGDPDVGGTVGLGF